MISDKKYFSGVEDVAENVIAAIAILQLGIPRLPDDSMILEVAAEHCDDRHREVTSLLQDFNRVSLDERIVIRFSSLIHLSCEWAWGYRQSRKTSIVKMKSGKIIRSRYRNSSSGRDLRRLVEVSSGNDELALARAIVDLSPHTFSELQLAASELGIKFINPAAMLCGRCISRASSLALKNLNTGRPQLREMDRAARAVKLAYQTVTGRSTSGRGIVSASYADSGKPTGELHTLLLRIGGLYDIKLVTPASDDRLRRL